MRAQHLVQPRVEQMRRRMRARNPRAAIRFYDRPDLRADFRLAAFDDADVLNEAVGLLGVADLAFEPVAGDRADVADLAARFAVERRAIEQQRRLARRGFREAVLADDADDLALAGGRAIAGEFGRRDVRF